GEALGLRPAEPGVLPAVGPAGHREDVRVAEVGKRVGGHRRTHAAGTVEDGELVLVRQAVLGPLFEIALRHVDRAGEVALVPLVLLADVAELYVLRAQDRVDLLWCRFLDALFQLCEVVAVGGVSRVSLDSMETLSGRSESA